MKKYKQFINEYIEIKKVSFSNDILYNIEKNLKENSTDLVYFDGEQHKINVEKVMKILKN